MSKAAFLVLLLALLPACVFVEVTEPLDIDLDKTELGSKIGKSSLQGVLWSVFWGDAGTHAAALDGDIKVIRHADKETYLVLGGVYYKQTTVLYGD